MSGLNRRAFLKSAGTLLGGAARGRLAKPGFALQTEPSSQSPVVRRLREDEVVEVRTELVGEHPNRLNQTWIETPEGFIWSPVVQPVRDEPNDPGDVTVGMPGGTRVEVVEA